MSLVIIFWRENARWPARLTEQFSIDKKKNPRPSGKFSLEKKFLNRQREFSIDKIHFQSVVITTKRRQEVSVLIRRRNFWYSPPAVYLLLSAGSCSLLGVWHEFFFAPPRAWLALRAASRLTRTSRRFALASVQLKNAKNNACQEPITWAPGLFRRHI